jgi:hypothetical protein
MQYVLPVQQKATSSSADRGGKRKNVDDAAMQGYPDPKRPPFFWSEVMFGKSIFYPSGI